MKLTIYRDSLQEQFKDMQLRDARFEHLTQEAQAAVTVVGKATLMAYDHSNYNVIYAPVKEAGAQ